MAIASKKNAAAPTYNIDDVMALVKKLQAENATLKATKSAAPANRFTVKVSPSGKGNLCIYGLSRYPFSFYRNQIEAILENAEIIKAFIAQNEGALSRKGE
jgi:hypothetical protein